MLLVFFFRAIISSYAAELVWMVVVFFFHKIKRLKKVFEKKADAELESFFDFCREGSAEQVENLIRNEKIDVKNAFFDHEMSNPLCHAIRSNNAEMVVVLLRHGAKFNSKLSPDLKTPLHIACEMGNYEIAEILVGRIFSRIIDEDDHYYRDLIVSFFNGNLNQVDKHSRTALHYAVIGKHIRIVDLLSKEGADFGDEILLTAKNVLQYFGGMYDEEAVKVVKLIIKYHNWGVERLLLRTFNSGDAAIRKFIADGIAEPDYIWIEDNIPMLCYYYLLTGRSISKQKPIILIPPATGA